MLQVVKRVQHGWLQSRGALYSFPLSALLAISLLELLPNLVVSRFGDAFVAGFVRVFYSRDANLLRRLLHAFPFF